MGWHFPVHRFNDLRDNGRGPSAGSSPGSSAFEFHSSFRSSGVRVTESPVSRIFGTLLGFSSLQRPWAESSCIRVLPAPVPRFVSRLSQPPDDFLLHPSCHLVSCGRHSWDFTFRVLKATRNSRMVFPPPLPSCRYVSPRRNAVFRALLRSGSRWFVAAG